MKNKISLIIKGFIFGIANIIPGVSGGTIALTMGVYEDMITSISHFFKKPKNSFKFLLPFGIGAVLSILLMSKLISFALAEHPFPTTLFFIGLIVGGIPLLTKKIKKEKFKISNLFLFLITFFIVIALSLVKGGMSDINLTNPNIFTCILLSIVGLIAAATMVIPGISGSFVLMLLGFYEPIVKTVGDITNFSNLSHNLIILVPFGIGVLLGVILISKLIEFLFKKYEIPTYYAVLGFVIASIITLLINVFGVGFGILDIVIGLILSVIGIIFGYKLGDE